MSLQHAGTIDKYYKVCAKRGLPSPIDSFHVNAFKQPSLTEPKLAPEPYRLRSSSVMIAASMQNGHMTYNTLHTDHSATTPTPPVRKRSISSFVPFRRPSYSVPSVGSARGSQAPSTPQQSQDDVETGEISGSDRGDDSSMGPTTISRQPSQADMNDEELDDLCLNDILEGVSNVLEVPN